MSPDAELAPFERLTPSERSALLWLARQSIRAALRGEDPPTLSPLTPALSAPGAVFVSLHHHKDLRGCIGTVHADRPLHEAVAHTARAAAFDDPRFAPLAEAELAGVDIEISRLGPLQPASAEQVRIGVHGVSLSSGERRSIFLPQVATLWGWDRDTLLTELCEKAMLPSDAWKDPQTQLMTFEAEVFGEVMRDQ